MPVLLSNRQTIRTQIRHQRNALSPEQQRQAAEQIADRALNFPPVAQAKNIALFLSFDGEIDTHPLVEQLWQQKKRVFLPALHPVRTGQLLFLHYTPETPLKANKFHISEPELDVRHLIPLADLDIVMVPLVAFDKQGQRLGMGGGFYDRTLQHWQRHGFLPVGLAHDCQQVEQLPAAEWDIPLPAILTPSTLWQW